MFFILHWKSNLTVEFFCYNYSAERFILLCFKQINICRDDRGSPPGSSFSESSGYEDYNNNQVRFKHL